MADRPADLKLLLLIVRNKAVLDEVVTGLLDAGITGATILDSRGLGSVLRHDMPIFAGLASLLPETTDGRVVVSLVTAEVIEPLKRFIDEMHAGDRPIAMVLPVEDAFGTAIPH